MTWNCDDVLESEGLEGAGELKELGGAMGVGFGVCSGEDTDGEFGGNELEFNVDAVFAFCCCSIRSAQIFLLGG